MASNPHFLALQNMYLAAPINAFYRPTIKVSDAKVEIDVDVSDKFFHSAEALVCDSEGNELGRGSGVFVRGKLPLKGALGYGV